MKKLNVIIKDKNTLVLNEEGSVGDLIDLTELKSVDLTNIESQIDDNKDKLYNQKLDLYINNSKKEFMLEKENALKDLNNQIVELKKEIEIEKNKNIDALKLKELELNNKFKEYEIKRKGIFIN